MIRPLESLYNNRLTQRYVKWANADKTIIKNGVKETIPNYNYEKLKENFPLLLMTWIPLIQCGFFAGSTKIPEDKKYSLIFNELYTAVLGVAITLLLRKQIKNLTNKFAEQAKKVYAVKSPADKEILNDGITTAVPAAITIVLCQYLAPVLTTPFATKTSQYFMKKGQNKDLNEQKPLDKQV